MRKSALVTSVALLAASTLVASAHATHHHRRHVAHHSATPSPAPASWFGDAAARDSRAREERDYVGGGIVTVRTALGIPITVASSAASSFEGFFRDLAAAGYRPRQIHCLAHGGHVANSNHYWGGACDVDQSGRNRTDGFMYHVASIAARWGLRDGCSFGDCGHVDVPRNVGGLARWNAALRSYARVGRHYRRRHYA